MTYAYLILGLYLLLNAFEWWLEFLNYKHIKEHGTTIPEELAAEIDKKVLSRTIAYTTEKIRFGIFSSLFDDLLLILFIYGGILAWYNGQVAEANCNFIASGLLFFIILTYGKTILDLPFSWFSTFKLENKYGFNTMTARLWLLDLFKTLLISTILIAILLSTAFYLITLLPNWWWLALWFFFFIFSMFLMYISPYVIEPLFNKFTPLDNDELEEKIKAASAKAGIEISRVFKMDASRRTKHSNAYFTGFGHVKRIVLYDTLLNSMNHEEIVAVLAHEAGHWKKKHIIKNLFIFELFSLIGAYLAFIILKGDLLLTVFNLPPALYNGFFMKVILLSFIASIITYPLGPLMNLLSRRFEREADDFACQITGSGQPLASALLKLSCENLSTLHPHPLYAFLHYSHPPALERIKYLQAK